MIEVLLSQQAHFKPIVMFEAPVFEYLTGIHGDSVRLHVAHIESIELTTDKRGQTKLAVRSKFTGLVFEAEVDAAAFATVRTLVDEVQRAMRLSPA